MAKQLENRVIQNVEMRIVKNSIYILIFFLTGCCALKSPVNKYDCQKERAEQKIIVYTRKFPELIQPTDTIKILDTILIESVVLDTSFFDQIDTVIVENEKLRIEYIKRDSLIYLKGECFTDTIYINKEILVEKIVVRQSNHFKNKNVYLICSILILIICFFIIRAILKRATTHIF